MHDFYWFVLFIALNGLLLLLLGVNVSRLRIKHKVAWGDGDNKVLMKAIRVHANGTEQVPMYGLLILALSFEKLSSLVLPALVIAFTLSRLVHSYGILFGKPIFRQEGGAAITFALQSIAVIALLVNLAAA